ncbi:MAG: ATP synthase subunit C [Planctomycetota bacterium]|jgi:V/A-type H+-transporting ATPase subunit K
MNVHQKRLKLHITTSVIVLFAVIAILGTVFCANAFAQASHDEETETSEITSGKAQVLKYAFIAAAAAFGLGAIGAGLAISHVGAAAMGAVAEKPQIAGQALIFVALAEGIVVFGLVTAYLILDKVTL